MKTKQKKEYVSPQIDVILVELEEGIAQTSGVDAGASPSTSGWTQGTGDTNDGEAF
ncbi:hypothetical protein [Sphingobacterium chuzhouense]|uniref:Uncharacterized protein n=1 Tax=Sphingobacterium chuzhouense TaxID=1742264 RepID=A0ABR7XXD9_9SPHI|nr:hypothetical protein [Sphingobacterium chuzhouense]MBD1423723.1 hypothetical protein [Sphingobacterium chuzhouense]